MTSHAIVFQEYGDPEVLQMQTFPVPEPSANQVLVRVRAAGVQPFDVQFRKGLMAERYPAAFPQKLGNEFAGTVEKIGEHVTRFKAGDGVLGWVVLAAYAEHVLVSESTLTHKPSQMPWEEAGALTASGQTALTALDALQVGPEDVLLVHAAAGGVGSFAVQLAKARGAKVIGTASSGNHAYLQSLGVEPVTYGEGLTERVLEIVPQGVTAALVAVGNEEALRVSLKVTKSPERIRTLAFHPLARQLGVVWVGSERSLGRLEQLVHFYTKDQLKVHVQEALPLQDAAKAHRIMETGHVRGKLVLLP